MIYWNVITIGAENFFGSHLPPVSVSTMDGSVVDPASSGKNLIGMTRFLPLKTGMIFFVGPFTKNQ